MRQYESEKINKRKKMTIEIEKVKKYLLSLQENICSQLEEFEREGAFVKDEWQREVSATSLVSDGGGLTRVLEGGKTFDKAGVNFSHVIGRELPASATAHRPELAGRSFQAMGVSLVIHPKNPFVPTSHANVRLFVAEKEGEDPVWWFGGGFDLTPYYGFDEDCIAWHKTAQQACEPFGENVYADHKKWCDEYFYLKHRNEPRGVGGLFYDDLNEWGFEKCFAYMQSVGNAFIAAYKPIVEKRIDTPYTQEHKDWQLYRRGRYVEFNLVFDRGTLFGLQSGGRTESILMSLPSEVHWKYDYHPLENSEEEKLLTYYLQGRDWLAS